MNVLSLFDGMSCGMLALKRAGITVDNYFAAEIDKYAIQVSKKNFPEIQHLGDVMMVNSMTLPKIDLLIGGSPCQGFSFAGKQLNFKDERSKLIFEYVRLLNELKPKYFLLENVLMKKEFQDVISDLLGVQPIMINSSLVSAQNRKRLYWTNIPGVVQPEDKGIIISDILEDNVEDKFFLSEKLLNGFKQKQNRRSSMKSGFNLFNLRNGSEKSTTLTARYHKTSMSDQFVCGRIVGRKIIDGKRKDYSDVKPIQQFESNKDSSITNTLTTVQKDNVIIASGLYRKLTPKECERLQTVPDDYTACVSNTQRYKMLGNGWTVDVIAHIFKGIK